MVITTPHLKSPTSLSVQLKTYPLHPTVHLLSNVTGVQTIKTLKSLSIQTNVHNSIVKLEDLHTLVLSEPRVSVVVTRTLKERSTLEELVKDKLVQTVDVQLLQVPSVQVPLSTPINNLKVLVMV